MLLLGNPHRQASGKLLLEESKGMGCSMQTFPNGAF